MGEPNSQSNKLSGITPYKANVRIPAVTLVSVNAISSVT